MAGEPLSECEVASVRSKELRDRRVTKFVHREVSSGGLVETANPPAMHRRRLHGPVREWEDSGSGWKIRCADGVEKEVIGSGPLLELKSCEILKRVVVDDRDDRSLASVRFQRELSRRLTTQRRQADEVSVRREDAQVARYRLKVRSCFAPPIRVLTRSSDRAWVVLFRSWGE